MRARRTISYLSILAGLVLIGVAIPGTASAKGPMDARVEGPGLAEPISLDWEDDETELNRLIEATGFWELAEAPSATEPAGELGARYVVSYSVHDDVGNPVTMALHAYPFAQPDPLMYAPAGQVYPMGQVPEGWRTATSDLTTWFETSGVKPAAAAADDDDDRSTPAPAAAAADDRSTPAPAAAATSGTTTGSWPLIALGGAGVVVLGGLVLLAVRRREAAPAH